MWKRLRALRTRWIRRAWYAASLVVLLTATWLFEAEMCDTGTTSKIYCGLVPVAFYWLGGTVAIVLALWAAFTFWRDAPGGEL